MFTLKIHFTRHVSDAINKPWRLHDESTTFIAADRVVVHAKIDGETWEDDMKHWELDAYSNLLGVINYDNGKTGSVQYANGRLITVERNGETAWYLVSRAWLLGPDGKTIEKLV